jgi:hypothetical protein
MPNLAGAWSFAVMGDMPYSHAERMEMPAMLADMKSRGADLVVHLGDFKSGASRCDDAIFIDRLALFQSAPIPLVFIPGDNEWTDCHRSGDDPLERLARLRQLFHADHMSLGANPIRLERQSQEYPENVRWRREGLMFIGLNVPGSNNNIGPALEPSEEYRSREQANSNWVAHSFTLARAEKISVLIIAIQANPRIELFNKGRPERGYARFLEQLRDEVTNFPGVVVLLHGDTHRHRIDLPMQGPDGAVINNFHRVETFGSPWLGWVEGMVESHSDGIKVRFIPHPWVSSWRTGVENSFKLKEPPLPPLPLQ